MNVLTEEQTQETASQLDAVFQSFPDILFQMDSDGTIQDYKAGNVSSLYIPPEAFLGRRMQDVLPPEIGIQFKEALDQVSRTGKVVSLEYCLLVPEGERQYEARLVRSPESKVVAVVRDITRHTQAEAQIRCQLQRLAALRSIDTAIASSFDIHLTTQVVLEQTTTQLQVDAADILLLDPHTQTLVYTEGRGFRTAALKYTRLRMGYSFAGQAALEQRIVNVPDLRILKTDFLRSPIFPQEAFIAYYAAPLIAKGQIKGVLEIFHRASLNTNAEWLNFFETLASHAAIAVDSAQLFDGLQRSNADLQMAYDATIEGWSKVLELRDIETEGHTVRVVKMTLDLARAMGLSEEELVHIRRGALLHDIGKMGIPDNILLKPGPLTEAEWTIMHQHPLYASEMLSPITYLRQALDIPLCHHEKWAGTGYPRELKKEQIPLAARIFSVVDVWDALTSDRPYRSAWTKKKAVEYISKESGAHFDPQVVRIFLDGKGKNLH